MALRGLAEFGVHNGQLDLVGQSFNMFQCLRPWWQKMVVASLSNETPEVTNETGEGGDWAEDT